MKTDAFWIHGRIEGIAPEDGGAGRAAARHRPGQMATYSRCGVGLAWADPGRPNRFRDLFWWENGPDTWKADWRGTRGPMGIHHAGSDQISFSDTHVVLGGDLADYSPFRPRLIQVRFIAGFHHAAESWNARFVACLSLHAPCSVWLSPSQKLRILVYFL